MTHLKVEADGVNRDGMEPCVVLPHPCQETLGKEETAEPEQRRLPPLCPGAEEGDACNQI